MRLNGPFIAAALGRSFLAEIYPKNSLSSCGSQFLYVARNARHNEEKSAERKGAEWCSATTEKQQ